MSLRFRSNVFTAKIFVIIIQQILNEFDVLLNFINTIIISLNSRHLSRMDHTREFRNALLLLLKQLLAIHTSAKHRASALRNSTIFLSQLLKEGINAVITIENTLSCADSLFTFLIVIIVFLSVFSVKNDGADSKRWRILDVMRRRSDQIVLIIIKDLIKWVLSEIGELILLTSGILSKDLSTKSGIFGVHNSKCLSNFNIDQIIVKREQEIVEIFLSKNRILNFSIVQGLIYFFLQLLDRNAPNILLHQILDNHSDFSLIIIKIADSLSMRRLVHVDSRGSQQNLGRKGGGSVVCRRILNWIAIEINWDWVELRRARFQRILLRSLKFVLSNFLLLFLALSILFLLFFSH